jgi:hypothetical protein
LRNIVRDVVMASYSPKTRPAIPHHHRVDVLKQRLDRGGLTAGRAAGKVAEPRSVLAAATPGLTGRMPDLSSPR